MRVALLTVLLLVLSVCPAPAAPGSEPSGESIAVEPSGATQAYPASPETAPDDASAAGTGDWAVVEPGPVEAAKAAPPAADTSQPGDAVLPADFYTQRMITVEGVITAIDVEAGSITINGADGEKTYVYDEQTRFQVKLNPVEPSELKVGSKMAGLYAIRDGGLYIGRVVIITGEPPAKKKSKRRRRRR